MRVVVKQAVYQPVVLRIDATMQEEYGTPDDPEHEEMYQAKLAECRALTRWFEQDAKRLREARLETIEAESIEQEQQGKAKQGEIAEHENHGGDWAQAFNVAIRRGAEAKGMCDELGANPPNRATSTAEERAAHQNRID